MILGENLFPNDSYDTPADYKRCLADRILLGSRLYFYWHNFLNFSRTGRCGRRGGLDIPQQISFSNNNIHLVENCGGKIHLRGLDNLRALNGGPVVFIGNHMSLLETALLHAIISPHLDFTFVIKAALLNVPHFGDIMRSLEAIAVDRSNPRDDLKAVLTQGKALLQRNKSIVIFPQSTRSAIFDPSKFNTIGLKLAKTANVPVVPLALKTDFLTNGKWIRDLGPLNRKKEIYFEFAPAIKIEGNGKAEHQYIIDFIQNRLKEWKDDF